MGTTAQTGAERLVARLMLPLCAASGAVVLSGFFFPEIVGTAVPGVTWLAVSLLFFISGLGYVAVLPYSADPDDPAGEPVLLAVRRMNVTDTLRAFASRQEPVALVVPVVVFAAFFIVQSISPTATASVVESVTQTVTQGGGPVFLGVMLLAVCYCLFLLVGPWGDVVLGDPETEPSYTYPTYFALVFTAGIAAGVVFWGPAESLFHYQTPPPYFDATPESAGAVGGALTYSLFHWGISAWSAYTVIGVPIAYFVFNRGAPLRVSTILAPFLGVSGLDSPWSKLVDTLAVFATIGGIATSVALVSEQFLTGIAFQWGVSADGLGPVVFVSGLILIVVLSAVTGVHRGIRRIAGLNLVLFGLFGLLLFAVGPRSFVIDQGTRALGRYAVNFLPMSLYAGGDWVASWTVWNWAWWFSWAPFAGLFIAALSRGRRVRTVVFTSVVATSAATMVWFLLVGATSLHLQTTGQADVLGAIAERGGSEAVAGFSVFAALPLGQLLAFLFLGLILVFMTTSADTSTLIVSILATRRGFAPTTGAIAFWGTVQGAVAVSVLLLGGGETLQALAVLTGGPFALLSLVALGGFSLTLYRRERGQGYTSLVRRVTDRLPTVQGHHDIDPPEED